MGVFSEACRDYPLPKMARLRQVFPRPKIQDVYAAALAELQRACPADRVTPGQRIAITAGSRGIANTALITKAVVDFCRSRGAEPFIVPAMGSHGGATAEGQLEILHDYGITQEAMGCPILSSMETVIVGQTEDGQSVHMDRYAYEADGTIVVNRIKPHTAFRGPYESGLMKMITIGLGKQAGAESCHATGFGTMARLLPMFAGVTLKNANLMLGLAILENAYDETAELQAMPAEEIPEKEPALLLKAKELMPRILFDSVDVLVVDKIGKNFSGDGHDPNITGRFLTPYASGGIQSQRMVILDLSDETHGNGCGLGLADLTTRRAWEKLDYEKMNANVLTNTVLFGASVPPWTENDHDAIALAIRTCNTLGPAGPRVVRIPNSAHLEYIQVSEALLREAAENPQLELIEPPAPLVFNEAGNLF